MVTFEGKLRGNILTCRVRSVRPRMGASNGNEGKINTTFTNHSRHSPQMSKARRPLQRSQRRGEGLGSCRISGQKDPTCKRPEQEWHFPFCAISDVDKECEPNRPRSCSYSIPEPEPVVSRLAINLRQRFLKIYPGSFVRQN